MKFILPSLFACWLIATTVAEDLSPAEYDPSRFFQTQILPILEKRCYECHSEAEEQNDGGLVLDTRAGLALGGDHGSAVVPKNLGKSPLIRAIISHDPGTLMPPEEPLPPLEIALLQTWVLLGAPDPREN
jgi:hypothetical protein